jgi:uncharacterized DUF497 family protein
MTGQRMSVLVAGIRFSCLSNWTVIEGSRIKMRYQYIEWDEHNLWKNEIKHRVTAEEIEQCFNNPPFVIFPHKQYRNRRALLGRTFGGRHLFVVFQEKSEDTARPIHARDLKNNERALYEKQTRR